MLRVQLNVPHLWKNTRFLPYAQFDLCSGVFHVYIAVLRSEYIHTVIWKEWIIIFRFILMRMLNKYEKLDNIIQGVVQVVVAIQSQTMSYGRSNIESYQVELNNFLNQIYYFEHNHKFFSHENKIEPLIHILIMLS